MPWQDVALNALADATRKDQFIATLGHELRNPLAVITSAVEAMDYLPPDSADFERLRLSIGRQCVHLSRIINGLLDISAFTNKKTLFIPKVLKLADVVTQGVEMAGVRISEAEHTLVQNIDTDVKVYGDLTRLAQVVSNLLTNASKFSLKPGKIHITVTQKAGTALICVRDEGIGISPDMLEQVFEVFVQVQHGRTNGGLGLGLTLSQQIVHAHHGVIEVQSEGLGKGTEFIVRLPLCTDAEASNGIKNSATGSYRILLVDDSSEVVNAFATVLRLRKHQTYVATTGTDAIKTFVKERPDIVLQDLIMPDMSGLELIKLFRQMDSGVTLVAVTGMGRDEDRKAATEAGANFFKLKPLMIKCLDEVFSARKI